MCRFGLFCRIAEFSLGAALVAGLSGTAFAQGISVTPSTLTFISQTVGTTSASQDVTVKNTGTAAVTINSVTVTGKNSGDFTASNACTTSLAGGASCTIGVTFHPSATGSRTASLSIVPSGFSASSVSLSGTGVQANIVLSPATLTFPSTLVNTPAATGTITVTNSGSADSSIISISISGPDAGDFTETNNCGSTLANSASCMITVTFTPSAGGTRTATLTVADEAPGSPQTATLSGQGADFMLSISPGSQSINAGGEAVYTLTVTPLGGFDQPISISCTNLPSLSTCDASPATVTPSGVTVDVTLDLSTTAPSVNVTWPRRRPPFGPLASRLLLALMVLLAMLTLFLRKPPSRLILGLALLAMLSGISCGESTANATVSTPGTSPGTYMFSVSGASGSLAHSISGTLTVNN